MASDEHNKLVDQTMTQVDPYRVRGTDFPAADKPAPQVPANYPHGFSQGHNELVEAPCGNRNLEDSGDQTPSVWGKGGKTWTVETNRGEGSEAATSMSYMNSVNLVSGMMDGGSPTPVGEVTDMNVHIPAGNNGAASKRGDMIGTK
jgi:hypothetical protein